MYVIAGTEGAIEEFRRLALGMENLDYDLEEIVRFLVDLVIRESASLPSGDKGLMVDLKSPSAQNLLVQGFVHHALGYPRDHEDGVILTGAMLDLLERLTENLVRQRGLDRGESGAIPAFHSMLGDDVVLKS